MFDFLKKTTYSDDPLATGNMQEILAMMSGQGAGQLADDGEDDQEYIDQELVDLVDVTDDVQEKPPIDEDDLLGQAEEVDKEENDDDEDAIAMSILNLFDEGAPKARRTPKPTTTVLPTPTPEAPEKHQFGGGSKYAITSEEQYYGLNDDRYDEMHFPMQGRNTFRGLDSGLPVMLTDSTGKQIVLNGPQDQAEMEGDVHEVKMQMGGKVAQIPQGLLPNNRSNNSDIRTQSGAAQQAEQHKRDAEEERRIREAYRKTLEANGVPANRASQTAYGRPKQEIAEIQRMAAKPQATIQNAHNYSVHDKEVSAQYKRNYWEQQGYTSDENGENAEPKALTKLQQSKTFQKADQMVQDMGAIAMYMDGAAIGANGVKAVGREIGNSVVESGVLNNVHKINPWAFRPSADAYYRGIGKTGFDDAMQAGVLRTPKGSGFSNDLYVSPDFSYAEAYSRDMPWVSGNQTSYVAEIPKNKLNVTPEGSDINLYSNQTPSTSDVRLLKEHWLKGYKEIPQGESGVQKSFMDLFKKKPAPGQTIEQMKEEIRAGRQAMTDQYNSPEAKRRMQQYIYTGAWKKPEDITTVLGDAQKLDQEGTLGFYAPTDMPHGTKYEKLRGKVMIDNAPEVAGSKKYTTIHELTHGVTDSNNLLAYQLEKDLKEPFMTRADYEERVAEHFGFDDTRGLNNLNAEQKKDYVKAMDDYNYFTTPTEIHARVNELRHHLFPGNPYKEFTDLDVYNLGKRLNDNELPNSVGPMLNLIKDPKAFKSMMNKVPAAAPVVGLSTAAIIANQQNKNKR